MSILNNISNQEKVDFARNLALLIKSGNPINESFSVLARQSRNPTFKKMLKRAQEKLSQGTPIHQIFEEDKNFDNVFVSFIRAGEESGTLDDNLVFLSDWLDVENRLKREMSSATLYPKIVIAFGTILAFSLSIFVLPDLLLIFDDLNVDIPFTTQILLFFTGIMEDFGLLIFLFVALTVVAFRILLKVPFVKKIIDIIMIKIPVFGVLNKEYQLTIISQLATVLIRSGVPIRQSIEIIAESVTNTQYSFSLNRAIEKIEKGTRFSSAIEKDNNLYPDIFVSVLITGENAGSFADCMEYLSKFFGDSVREKTRRLPLVLEPILLIFIGAIVAFIASAMVLPIYQATTGI